MSSLYSKQIWFNPWWNTGQNDSCKHCSIYSTKYKHILVALSGQIYPPCWFLQSRWGCLGRLQSKGRRCRGCAVPRTHLGPPVLCSVGEPRAQAVLQTLWIQGDLRWLKATEFMLLGDSSLPPRPSANPSPSPWGAHPWGASAYPVPLGWAPGRAALSSPGSVGGTGGTCLHHSVGDSLLHRVQLSKEEELVLLPLPYPERSPHHVLGWRSCWSCLVPCCGSCRPCWCGCPGQLSCLPCIARMSWCKTSSGTFAQVVVTSGFGFFCPRYKQIWSAVDCLRCVKPAGISLKWLEVSQSILALVGTLQDLVSYFR